MQGIKPARGPTVVGFKFPALEIQITKEMIRGYAEASYDFNPLHLDEQWMAKAEFGGTRYEGIIAHGLMTYSLVARMITDVVYPLGGWHERCEMRFKAPIRPGDIIVTSGSVTHVQQAGDWMLYAADVVATRQDGVAAEIGDAYGRVPINGAGSLEAFIRERPPDARLRSGTLP